MNASQALDRAAALPLWTAPGEPRLLGGGITNFNVVIEDQGRRYVVRVGDDIPVHGIMRFNEVAISRAPIPPASPRRYAMPSRACWCWTISTRGHWPRPTFATPLGFPGLSIWSAAVIGWCRDTCAAQS